VAAALAGGGIGDAGLAAIGVSTWQFGLAVAGGTGIAAAAVLGALTGWTALHARGDVLDNAALLGRLTALPGLRSAAGAEDPSTGQHLDQRDDVVDPDAITAPLPRVRVSDDPGPGELAG
jgi:hypothetical protein